MLLNPVYVDDLCRRALLEDMNYIDITTDYLIPEQQTATARLMAKDDGVLCGVSVAQRVFELLDSTFRAEIFKKDGETLKKGDVIAEFTGNARCLLKGERTALNLIQHMSGVATATRRAVELVQGTKASVTDTRKTLPGMRPLEKYAVTTGGGKNHRYNLSDAALIKDNHIDASDGISNAVHILRKRVGHMAKIEVEARNLDELREALRAGADTIMLDNMTPFLMRQAVEINAGRAVLEASGGITMENLREVAETGVDIISLGFLTHSVKAFDISMKIVSR